MTRSPRAEALAIARSDDEIICPQMPDLVPDSPEALEFGGNLKPLYFASLARAIDTLFAKVLEQKGSHPPNGLVRDDSPFNLSESLGPWQQLAQHMDLTLFRAQQSIKYTHDFQRAREIRAILNRLNPDRAIGLREQLSAGGGTFIASTLGLLKDFPAIVEYHEPGHTVEEVVAIARPSVKLPQRLAKLCINRMMAAQTALVDEREHDGWRYLNRTLNPKHFRLHSYPDGRQALDYVDLTALEIPDGYIPRPGDRPLKGALRVGEVACREAKTVGCPVTLLPGRLSEMWNWAIDLAGEKRLWTEFKASSSCGQEGQNPPSDSLMPA